MSAVYGSSTVVAEGVSALHSQLLRAADCPPNDGSASLPFRSIGRAVCAASAGTLIVVTMDGTFYEVPYRWSSLLGCPPQTHKQDMLEWHSCASCVHFVLEDRADNSELGTATLLSGGLVYLRKVRIPLSAAHPSTFTRLGARRTPRTGQATW